MDAQVSSKPSSQSVLLEGLDTDFV